MSYCREIAARPAHYVRSAEPSIEPVSVIDIKEHCRIDNDDEDMLVESYLKAARRWCEDFTRRSFINTTWVAKLDSFPGWVIEIEKCNLQSVTSVQYVDTAGATQTFSNTLVDTHSKPARITPAYGYDWPSVRDQMNAVTVSFVAGYGATAATVPDSIKSAIKILCAHLYENREPVVTGTIISPVPFSVESLLWMERWSIT